MIWILSLCLLAVAAWLFFNALNERRWVDDHSHDETVASDEGLLAGFTAKTRTALTEGDGKVSMDKVNSGVAHAVSVVKDKSSELGKKIETKIASARTSTNPDGSPASAGEENSLIGRVVAKVGATAASIDDKLDTKMKATATGAAASSAAGIDDQGGTFFERTSRKVTQRSGEITQKVAHRAKVAADKYEESHRTVDGASENMATRVSAKVGDRVNEMDAKIVDAGKSAVEEK